MKTYTIHTYNYEELGDAAKAKARDWFRKGLEGEIFWSESVIAEAKTIGRFLGWEIERIYWSGFWSQGDGACFEGRFNSGKVSAEKLREYAPTDKRLHRIVEEIEAVVKKLPGCRDAAGEPLHLPLLAEVKHQGCYSHENCTEFRFWDNSYNEGVDDGIREDLISAARDFMHWIYRRLEEESEFRNSDETVASDIIANEYEFYDDGTRAREA